MRRAAAALLALAALGLAVVSAIAIRDRLDLPDEHATLVAVRAVLYHYGTPVVIGLVAASIALAVLAAFALRGAGWAFVGGIAVAAVGVAAAWLGRHEIVVMEGRYAHKSPYVALATRLAIAGTIYCATLAIASSLALRRRS